MAEKIPNDIILEIFSRLDTESLFRVKFACCKAWQHMIDDDPCFVNMHLARTAKSPGIPLLISRLRSNPMSHFSLHGLREDGLHKYAIKSSFVAELMMDATYCIKTSGSCNGLLCFQARDYIFLCNPLLKQSMTLPIAPLFSPFKDVSGHSYSLGFDAKSNTYKIVHFRHNEFLRSEKCVWVYTLGRTNSWPQISEKPKYPISGPVFADGALHYTTNNFDVIESFDLAKEEFYVISCPSLVRKYFMELYGTLAMADLSQDTCVEIWLWKENHDGAKRWAKEYKLDIARPRGGNGDVNILGKWENGKILLKRDDGYFTYNLETDYLQCVNITGMPVDYRPYCMFCIGYGSLVSLSPYK